ncbi:MAG: T9SS type A sorting domain-containing protein [Prevotella sp.]|nr:T9SS type A sorting domain-containing protein [Prevotella sp.]
MLKAADMPMEAMQQDMSEEITIAVSGQTVTVSGAQGETLEVISLTGRRVLTVKIESPAQRIELNILKGCYLLKVGKVVRKVSLR